MNSCYKYNSSKRDLITQSSRVYLNIKYNFELYQTEEFSDDFYYRYLKNWIFTYVYATSVVLTFIYDIIIRYYFYIKSNK